MPILRAFVSKKNGYTPFLMNQSSAVELILQI
jgi:hypothetical protein